MNSMEMFQAALRERMLSRGRLFRFAALTFLRGGSKETIVRTFVAYGQSEEEALASYNRIVEAASKVEVRGDVRVHIDEEGAL